MILGPVLAIKKFLVTFMLFYFQFLNLKITKTFVTFFVLFWFCKLASYWCMTTTIVSWGHKAIVVLLQVARRVKKMNHLRLPREFDIDHELPLWRKLLLLHHSALGLPTSGNLTNRGVPSEGTAGAWVTAPEDSLCVVNDQPVGNPKRKV
jgi:hypothetical protein